MRSVDGVDTNRFYSRVPEFIKETQYLRRDGRNMLLIMDRYACNIAIKTLQLLCDNDITVSGRPFHTSDVLMPLEVSVFGLLREKFRRLLSFWKITKTKDDRNDVFTIREILRDAYHVCVNEHNEIAGFPHTGLWSDDLQGVDIESIWAEDFISR